MAKQKARKTISVDFIKECVNNTLRSGKTSPDDRAGRIELLNVILHESGNYRGFLYLTVDEVPVGELPGIIINDDKTFSFEKTDPTRVRYI